MNGERERDDDDDDDEQRERGDEGYLMLSLPEPPIVAGAALSD